MCGWVRVAVCVCVWCGVVCAGGCCGWVGEGADGLGGWEVCGCVVRVGWVVDGLGGGVVYCDRGVEWWVYGCGWVEVRWGAGGWLDVRVGGILLSGDAITN